MNGWWGEYETTNHHPQLGTNSISITNLIFIVLYPSEDTQTLEVAQTEEFKKWLQRLRSSKAFGIILLRLRRIQKSGNLGDHKYINHGIFELRIHLSPGYRVYCSMEDSTRLVLLFGGVKKSQKRDIIKAVKIHNHLNNHDY